MCQPSAALVMLQHPVYHMFSRNAKCVMYTSSNRVQHTPPLTCATYTLSTCVRHTLAKQVHTCTCTLQNLRKEQ